MSMLYLEYEKYYDRVLAGWLGKSLGGVVGAPFECHKQFNFVSEDRIWPDKLWPNDDLDIQVVWLEALQEYGLDLTSRELAKIWMDRCFYTCCEYGVFVNNFEHGIYPPLSGKWHNEWFQSSEGCPIRSEIWGFIAPGNPALAMKYAEMDGCLDHTELSIELEKFLSAAASLAFFENSVETLLDKCCACFSEKHPAVQLYRGVQAICRRTREPYAVWQDVVRQYGHRDGTKALINNAFAFMALILGENDFKQTMRLCLQAGWDCDCTAATAGALLGVLFGKEALPQDWLKKQGKNLVCAVEIKHQFQPLDEFARETCDIGLEMARCKNQNVQILEAPAFRHLPQRRKQIVFSAEYPEGPELFRNKSTQIALTLSNETGALRKGMLNLTVPPSLICTPSAAELTLNPGDKKTIFLSVTATSREGLPEKNLIRAEFCDENFTFGLLGTARLLVYGPYWDMWDTEKNEVCPYQNDQLTCNPGNMVEYAGDAMNMHVRQEHPYLDEKKLLQHSIPEERPVVWETSENNFSSEKLTSFIGTGCWYIETTIKSEEAADVILHFFADCPFKCWFDGVLVSQRNKHTSQALQGIPIHLSGTPQRLLFKFSTELDHFQFSCSFHGQPAISRKAPVSPRFSKYYLF